MRDIGVAIGVGLAVAFICLVIFAFAASKPSGDDE